MDKIEVELTYEDFIKICHIEEEDLNDFAWGLRVDEAGVWGPELDKKEVTALETEEILPLRPPERFGKPIIIFPCKPEDIRAFLVYAAMEECLEELYSYVSAITVEKESFDELRRAALPSDLQPKRATKKQGDDIEDYINKRNAEGAIEGDIIDELHDKKGPFRLTYRAIGHALGIPGNEDSLYNSYKTKIRRRGTSYKKAQMGKKEKMV